MVTPLRAAPNPDWPLRNRQLDLPRLEIDALHFDFSTAIRLQRGCNPFARGIRRGCGLLDAEQLEWHADIFSQNTPCHVAVGGNFFTVGIGPAHQFLRSAVFGGFQRHLNA